MVRRGAPAPWIGRLHQPPESEGPDFDGAAAVAPAPDRGCNRSRKRRYPEAEGTGRDRAGMLAPSHAPGLAAHRPPRVSPRLHAGQRPRLVDRKVIPFFHWHQAVVSLRYFDQGHGIDQAVGQKEAAVSRDRRVAHDVAATGDGPTLESRASRIEAHDRIRGWARLAVPDDILDGR